MTDITKDNEYGYNVLMIKAEEGNFEDVQKILADSNKTNINAINKNGFTAISLATKNGHYRIVEALIQAGADPNIKNYSGQSPLFLGCWHNHLDIVNLLLQNNAEINAKDQRGWTSLMIAAFNGNKEIVKTLIENKADVSIKDCFDKTALDRARDPKVKRMLQNSSQILESYNSKIEEEKSIDLILNSSPARSSLRRGQRNSSIKKTSPSPDANKSKQRALDNVKGKDFSDNQNYMTTSSTAYPSTKAQSYPTQQTQLLNKRTGASPDKNNAPFPKNQTKDPKQTNSSSLNANRYYDPKISTRFVRIREERNNTSIDKSFRTTSMSPTKSALPSSRHTKGSPNKSKEMRSPNPSISEARKQSIKMDFQKELSDELENASEKVHDIVSQRASLEIPRFMEKFEEELKSEMNSIFLFRADNIFKTMHAAFNLKVNYYLSKLGYDTSNLDLTPFDGSDAPVIQNQKLFEEKVPKYDYEKEVYAIEKDITTLERSLCSPRSINERSIISDPNNTRVHTRQKSYLEMNQMTYELFEQLGREIKSCTEYLMESSTGKINDLMREETKLIYQRMMEELNRKMDMAEEEYKNIMDELINQKINAILEVLGTSIQNVPKSGQKASPGYTPSKEFFSPSLTKSSEKKITFGQETERPPLKDSFHSHQKSSSQHKERGALEQTKSKIEKLKNSLNFIIEDDRPHYNDRTAEIYTVEETQQEPQYNNQDLKTPENIQKSRSKGSLLPDRPNFMDSIKNEHYQNLQAVSKLDEIRSFYQKKYDKS